MKNISFLLLCVMHYSLFAMTIKKSEKQEYNAIVGIYSLYGASFGATNAIVQDFVFKNIDTIRKVFLFDIKQELVINAGKGACRAFLTWPQKTFLYNCTKKRFTHVFSSFFNTMMQGAQDNVLQYAQTNGFDAINKALIKHQFSFQDYIWRILFYAIIGGCVGGVCEVLKKFFDKSQKKNVDCIASNNKQHKNFLIQTISYATKSGIATSVIGMFLIGNMYVIGSQATGFSVSSVKTLIFPTLLCFSNGFLTGCVKKLCY